MRLPGLVTVLLVALTLSACSGGRAEVDASPATTDERSAEPAATEDGALATELTPSERRAASLVEAWYARADPRVCARMTDRLLEFGWEHRGDRGRRACRASMRQAEPVQAVSIAAVTVDGDAAQVEVSYELDGSRRSDTVLLVRRDGRWLLDEVAAVEDPPETPAA